MTDADDRVIGDGEPPRPPDVTPEPPASAIRPGQEGGLFIDFPHRIVAVQVRKPLDLAPTRVDVPIALWKKVAAAIADAEANAEIQRTAPRIAMP